VLAINPLDVRGLRHRPLAVTHVLSIMKAQWRDRLLSAPKGTAWSMMSTEHRRPRATFSCRTISSSRSFTWRFTLRSRTCLLKSLRGSINGRERLPTGFFSATSSIPAADVLKGCSTSLAGIRATRGVAPRGAGFFYSRIRKSFGDCPDSLTLSSSPSSRRRPSFTRVFTEAVLLLRFGSVALEAIVAMLVMVTLPRRRLERKFAGTFTTTTKVVEQVVKLVEGTVDNSSLLSLVLGKKHLENQGQPVAEPEKDEPARSRSATKSGSEVQPQNAALAKVEELLQALLARFDSVPAPEPIKKGRKRRNPGKRDTVIFTAILAGFKGPRYCSFLDKYGTRPKWSDSGPATYLKSYQVGFPWRKKVQDEKTRAKLRMQGYPRSELATALNTYLPEEFDKISPLLAQLASRE
jgi:hypothetical protein